MSAMLMPLHRFVVLLCLISSFGNALRADEPAQPDAGRRHTLTVTVVDAGTGQPVADAAVVFRQGRDFVKATTLADGMVVLLVPLDLPNADQLSNADVTVNAPGYGPRRMMWNASAGRVLETLPEACTVRLTRGLRMGGVVRDAQGQPVVGARIELYGSGYKGVRLGGDTKTQQEYPEVSAYGNKVPVTDGDGAWGFDDFPADLGGLTLTVIRPGGARSHFKAGDAPDLAWQAGPRLDLRALKSGQAVLTLKEGFTVTGKVEDEAGRPVAGATLRARDAASRNPAHEFTTDLEGRFELRNWDAAKVLISAERDGYRGTTVTVPTGTDAAEAKIVLRPGQPLKMRVLDDQGAPIAGAEIMADTNPGAQIIAWKAVTDAEGRVVWAAAPDAPVKYWIMTKQHGGRTAKFLADGTEHVVRFRAGADQGIRVQLHVVDAATGAPLPGFEVWRRMPRDQGPKPWGETDQAGTFANEIRKDEFTKGIVEAYRLEVRAVGYGTWGSETLDFSNGDQAITVQLVKGGESTVPPPTRQVGNEQDGDTNPALLVLATQVARLLESGDVPAFAQAVSASPVEWQAILPGGVDSAMAPHNRDNGRTLERHRKAVTTSAERLMTLARGAGIGPGMMRFDVKSVTAPGSGASIFRIEGHEVRVPRLESISIVLTGEPTGAGGAQLRGDYQLAVGTSYQLPAGWKSEQGVRWRALPAGVGDDSLKAELRLINRVSGEALGDVRSLSGPDDPALAAFGENVVTLLKTGDVPAFVTAAGPARLGLSASDLEKNEMELAASVRTLLDWPARLGIDFSKGTVTVQQVVATAVAGNAFGNIDALGARSLQVVLAVEGGRTPAGQPTAGRYAVEFGPVARRNGIWLAGSPKVRWRQMPEGLLADEDKQAVALENYVAEHRSLPPGHAAPEIELVRLGDSSRIPLSAYRGKFVILEFWATWCGPCQEPMAMLQQLVQTHPEWKDRVEVITVSIDSKPAKATAHLEGKQWNQTTNFWAGEGEFKSAPALAYRVSGIPSSYVIGPDGKIIAADHPASMDFSTLLGPAFK